MADAHANFAYSLVATAPSPATSGTSLVVTAGQGALFPTVPFNATIWPTATFPTSTNAEIVRVTARSTDTLTITRAQESTGARTVIVGDQIAATATAKTFTDIENVVPPGTIVDYATNTGADMTISATTDGTAQAIVTGSGFTANGTDSYWIDFYCICQVGASSQIVFVIYDGGTVIGSPNRIAQTFPGVAGTPIVTIQCRTRITPSAASHTYGINAWRVTANGVIFTSNGGFGRACYMSVTKAS